tara:strand:+ start:689 stop:1786 length:1098 start_codon:yes stop_codon:yes gene_type:complete
MKKILSLLMMALMVLSVTPMIVGEEGIVDGGIELDVGEVNEPPEVCTDSTQRSWNPNDQTYYTAELYGTNDTNDYGDDYYDVSVRGNYVFTGETVTYYVIVEDENGEDDTDEVILQKDDSITVTGVGSCSEIENPPWANGDTLDQFDCGTIVYDDDTMNAYRCVLVVQDWTGVQDINVKATDDDDASDTSTWSDRLTFNPPLSVTLTNSIDFGNVEEDSTVTSSAVYLNNVGSDGVVMDMYIASDDYFTDPLNPTAICGIGNGIPYYAFSYYATKGSVDSGDNDNVFPGLGESRWNRCEADDDEYTPLPSHSGEIDDMCRIVNHLEEGSFLTQGQSMSLTFQLDVPEPCEGSFTNGKFHFAGRVV